MASLFCSAFNFWSELRMYQSMLRPWANELSRNLNPNTTIRKLKDDDPDILKSLSGRVCVLTGGSRGIGQEVAKTLLRKDCHVITGSSSSPDKIDARQREILAQTDGKGKLDIWTLDLASMRSTVEFADRVKKSTNKVNFLICVAGTMTDQHQLTEDGFEKQFAVNYLSQMLLAYHLLPVLADTASDSKTPSRIVFVASCGHTAAEINFDDLNVKSCYSPYFAYGQSKLAQVMSTYKMVRWLNSHQDWNQHIKVFALHPGIVKSDMINNWQITKKFPQLAALPIFRTPKEGSETVIFAALSSQLNQVTGKYLEDSAIGESSLESHSQTIQDRFWQVTWDMLGPWTNDQLIMQDKNN